MTESTAPAKFYRTILHVEVLTRNEPADPETLAELHEQITAGDASGSFTTILQEEVTPRRMALLLEKQGSDPGFLLTDGDEEPPTCILTGAPGEDPDDCTTHGHEEDVEEAFVWNPNDECSWGPFKDPQDAAAFVHSDKHLESWCLVKDRPWSGGPNYAPSEYHGAWPKQPAS